MYQSVGRYCSYCRTELVTVEQKEVSVDSFPTTERTHNDISPVIERDDEGKWTCIHCTFQNLPTTKICEICNRTSWVDPPNKSEVVQSSSANKVPVSREVSALKL